MWIVIQYGVVSFINPDDGKVTYFEVYNDASKTCNGNDPVKFTEAITMGSSNASTMTPYKSCTRPEYTNATGARHIIHHMLFQYDVMVHLHAIITQRWGVLTLWEAASKCYKHDYCQSRVAEYELYYAFVSEQYPERVRLDTLHNGLNICKVQEYAVQKK